MRNISQICQIYNFTRVSRDDFPTNLTNETTKLMKVEWPIIQENWRIKSQEYTTAFSFSFIQERKDTINKEKIKRTQKAG